MSLKIKLEFNVLISCLLLQLQLLLSITEYYGKSLIYKSEDDWAISSTPLNSFMKIQGDKK